MDPDLNKSDLFSAIEVMINEEIAGVIISNGIGNNLKIKNIKQTGGLSGEPLFRLSSEKLSEAYNFAEDIFRLLEWGVFPRLRIYTKNIGADILQISSSL